jgi:hypothetical protein
VSEPFVRLLVVADRFALSFGYFVVMPDFAVPADGWTNTSTNVEIVRPDGSVLTNPANISTTHFLIRDPTVPVSRRWRVQLNLLGLAKDDVPIGSEIHVPAPIAMRLGAEEP